MLRFALLFVLAAAPCAARDFVADAFGVVPKSALSEDRAAWSGARANAGQIGTAPPEASGTVLLFVGPKALVAGKDDGHAVALVLDRHGNLVADGTPVGFLLGAEGHTDPASRFGVGEVLFRPPPHADVFVAGATAGERQSARATYRVVSDLASAKPVLLPLPRPAVPETLVRIPTAPLFDRFGNAVEDGVGLSVILQHVDWRTSVLSAVVRSGMAEAVFLPRDVTTGGALTATLAANASAGTPFQFAEIAPLGQVPMQIWPQQGIDAVVLRVGPVMTNAGHLLNDGTPVKVSIVDGIGGTDDRDGWLRDGHFETSLALPPDGGPFVVTLTTALGRETRSVSIAANPRSQHVRGVE